MKETKLIEACNNLTAVLGLEPKISTESKKGMKKDLLEAAKLINPGDMSGMAPETISVLKELGVELEEMKVEEKPKKKKAEKKIKEEKEEEKVEEKPKKKKAEKVEGSKTGIEKTEFGHRVGSMAGAIDILLRNKKCTKEKIVESMMVDFNKPKEVILAKLNAHIKHLINAKKVAIEYNEKKDTYSIN